ncbi:MAG: hypothetical protein ACRDP5_27125, partial [Streptosporangiaceae bacterium]
MPASPLPGHREPAPPGWPRGPRGFPVCALCQGESTGPASRYCTGHWTPELDPEGAASARALGLLDASSKVLRDMSLADPGDASRLQPGDGSRAPCAWCGGPVPARARRDAVCCSKRCRQARH